jgi:hypothetical protein
MKVIITGTTGMVGEGVMHVCLQSDAVSEVLSISRKDPGIDHPKLKKILIRDFFNLEVVKNQLSGFDACFFCLGKSSVGMDKKDYERLTYDLTINLANILVENNPGMTFCYVSGQGTDGSEKSFTHWARVKGKTENDLRKLQFRQVFAYRPGFIKPIPGLKHSLSFYKYINWLFPMGKRISPDWFNTLEEVGLSMISVTKHGHTSFVLQGKDISETAVKEK